MRPERCTARRLRDLIQVRLGRWIRLRFDATGAGTTIWSETVLHTFPASYVSLDLGVAPVVSHNREYVYGMIESAVTGAFEVFQLHLVGTVWKYSVIYTVPSGLTSFSNLVIDSKRNLYFYALSEQYGYGPLLRLSPPRRVKRNGRSAP